MALGMENGTIRDDQITASSEYNSAFSASNGRLNYTRESGKIGVWSARISDRNQWLQEHFERSTIITGISTQGRDSFHQHVKSYTISFSVDGAKFHNYQPNGIPEIFEGNSDGASIVNHIFAPSIVAEIIRVQPIAWKDHISMRAEFYGCYY
ncbi:Hypothetical predicted protein [Paramuricea clavata]|uniref:Uncharacterized protein n=1 Tax=Paramuricea clavata TaxID=317549 RepID=A0A6S7HFI4_PARCT|nr:Hypothetical predicted protein [Paramuricea clavata]